MYRFIILFICSTILFSCKSEKNRDEKPTENLMYKEMLQGVWIDDATECPIFNIKGDTIFYADPSNSPTKFKVINDSLFIYGSDVNIYKIQKIDQYNFWFDSMNGDVIQLTKSDNSDDLSSFSFEEPAQEKNEVIKKDSVIIYKNKRYRGYVYINPSTIKVTQSRVSNEGISVDNEYFDNIIHICVFDGKKKLCSKDINKNMMNEVIPLDFLNKSILSDMNFTGVKGDGYHYQATVCIPNDASCYLVNVVIDNDSNVKFDLAK